MAKNRKRAGFVLLFMLLIAGCDRDKTDVEYVEQAKHYQDAGEMAKAGIELKNALRVNPDNGEARRLLGMLYLTMGNGEGAEKELRRAVDLKVSYQALALPILQSVYLQQDYKKLLQQIKMPEGLDRESQAEWYVLRGRAQLESGKLQESRSEFQMAARIAPDSKQTLLGKALDAFFSKKLDVADSLLDVALGKHPDFAEALTLKGDIKRLQSRLSEAESLYTRAIAARRNNTADLYKRALVRLELNDYKNAETDINQLSVRVPKQAEVYFLKGVLGYKTDNDEVAESALREAARLRPNSVDIQYYLALTLKQRNQPQQARGIFEALYAKNSMDYRVALQLALLYVQDKAYADAIKVLSGFKGVMSGDATFLAVFTDALLRKGDFSDATGYAEKLDGLEPKSIRTKMLLGSAYFKVGRYVDAFSQFDQALQIAPGNDDVHKAKINSFLMLNQTELALQAATKWLAVKPQSIDARLQLAAVHRQMMNFDDARQTYKDVLNLDGKNKEAVVGLASLDVAEHKQVDALHRYKDLWKLSPGDVEAALALAAEDVRQGSIDAATSKLQMAIDHHPEDLRVYLRLAQIFFQNGKFDQILSLLRPVESKFGSNPGWLNMMVETLLASGNVQSAHVMIDKLGALQGGDEGDEAYYRAQLYAMTGKGGLVGGELENAYRHDPNDLRIGLALFRRYVLVGETVRAREMLGRLEKQFGESPEVVAQRGWFLYRTGKYAEAAKDLRSAYASSPSQGLLINYSRAETASGNADVAIKLLTAELDKFPGNAVIVKELAEVLLSVGRNVEAIDLMRSFINQGGRDPIIYNNLAWVLKSSDIMGALKYAELADQLAPRSAAIKDTLGQIQLKAGQRDQGLRSLVEAVQLSGGDVVMRLHYAEVLAESGLYSQARNELNQIEVAVVNGGGQNSRVIQEKIQEIRKKLKE